MKVMWVVNIMMPVAASALNVSVDNFSGGWLTGAYNALKTVEKNTISIVFPYRKRVKKKNESGNVFYTFIEKYNSIQKLTKQADEIIKDIEPDIIHIFGTEFIHTSVFLDVAKKKNIPVVISIQGLVSEYAKHFYSDLSFGVVYGMSLRNFIFRDSVYGIKKQLEKLGRYEIKSIQNVENVIGRTSWDKACVKRINRNIRYYHNEETLRDSFYEFEWNYNSCIKNSLFFSQCSSPVKGFHFLIEAVAIVKKLIPDIRVFVVGKNIIINNGVKDRLGRTHYMNFCRKQILRNELADNFIFLGRLSEKEMVQAMLKTNIFVLPSTIENSPNTLCEAMLLGVPCIASYVGGVPSLVEDKETALTYQHNSVTVLSELIIRLLQNPNEQFYLSRRGRETALHRHDRYNNAKILLDIYTNIIMDSSKA